MSKNIEVPFEVLKTAIRQSVVLKRWYKRSLQKANAKAAEVEEVQPEPEEIEKEQTDLRSLERSELVKLASASGVKRASQKSNEELYSELEKLGEDNADNDDSGS